MSKEGKSIHPVSRAILAIAALIVIVIAGNMLVASLGIGHKAVDLTENKVHSLSDGTKEILSDLGAPVTIRYYATRGTKYLPEELKLHMRRVDDLLAEYEDLADGQLKIEHLDPEPDTDAEDAANLDGIRGQQINEDNIYFGMAISCLDRTTTIPFLDPGDETMLEYNISRAIAEVSAARKPVIGLMSALDLAGGPPAGMGQQPSQPWVIYNQLSQSYEVEDLGMTPESIDPERIQLLLVMHPAEITPEAEFAIDQYLLQGGAVMACLDSYSAAAAATSGGGGNPMMQQQGTPTSSTLPTLLDAWGVEMTTDRIVGDYAYPTQMDRSGTSTPVLVTVPSEGMPQEDSVVTKDIGNVMFYMPAGFTKVGGSGVSMETLVRSSSNAATVAASAASQRGPRGQLESQLEPSDKRYDFVVQLRGSFKTAFPDGNPARQDEDESAEDGSPDASEAGGEDEQTSEDSEEAADETPAGDSLKEATESGSVFLISDVDAFFDQIAYQVQRLGNTQLARPQNGNSALFFNLIDMAAASPHLIGSRSRAATSRPFTVFREMEAEAEQRVGDRIDELEQKASEAQQRLTELQSQRGQSSDVYLTPEQEQEIDKFQEQQVEARRQIRELEKDLRREKDDLAARIIAYNIAGVPGLIILVGLGLFAARRAKTRAR